ncbi:MAG: hypothetical protein ACRDL5_13110, partial [Solirubrobacteraceae bacterium]
MLDPRIYRAGLVVAALALVVLAFSLGNQQQALSPTLAPQVFDGASVSATMRSIARDDPTRAPGSYGDSALAAQVAGTLGRTDGLKTASDTFTARTVSGSVTLDNVIAVRPGMQQGSIAVVAPRDGPGVAGAAPTAMLLELARDLAGETLHRSVVLASISGSQGAAGAAELTHELPGPVDAVIVLGDVAAAHPTQPIVLPWSARSSVAPSLLRNTLAAALSSQASLKVGAAGLGAQFTRLAFPFTLGVQGPFAAASIPAVELSLTGERAPLPGEPVAGTGRITDIGRAVLSAVSALDAGRPVPAPSPYLLLDGKLVPGGALSLFSLALLVPVLMTAVDAVARAR